VDVTPVEDDADVPAAADDVGAAATEDAEELAQAASNRVIETSATTRRRSDEWA
jgi:hypothetical protein